MKRSFFFCVAIAVATPEVAALNLEEAEATFDSPISAHSSCDPGDALSFRERSHVWCLVTGMENSGTTLLSRLIMNAPQVSGAFECGVLLAPVPSELPAVQPFWSWLQGPVSHKCWGIPTESLEHLSKTAQCHDEVYRGIYELSPVINRTYEIVDKIPAYVYHLRSVLQRAPGVPLVLVAKEKDAQLKSWHKRGVVGEKAEARYVSAVKEVQAALHEFPDRILQVDYNDIINDTSATMQRVFHFLDLGDWREDYVTMAPLNAKYAHIGARPPRLWKWDTEPFSLTRRLPKKHEQLKRTLRAGFDTRLSGGDCFSSYHDDANDEDDDDPGSAAQTNTQVALDPRDVGRVVDGACFFGDRNVGDSDALVSFPGRHRRHLSFGKVRHSPCIV